MKKLLIIIVVLLVALVGLAALFSTTTPSSFGAEKVALVRIEGPILESASHVKELKGYREDDSIQAIVIRVDSPGGTVAPAQEIYREVKKAAASKNVVVSMGSIAASGGYYVASPATKIMANPGTITGSIGVILEVPNFEGLMDKIGIKTTVVKSGEFKDMASTSRKLTPEEISIYQKVMDDVHYQFIEAVAEGRGMDIETVMQYADGRIFSGRQARELGLVDELGGLEDAIALGAKLAGIKGEPYVVYKKEQKSFFDLFNNRVSSGVNELIPSVKIKYLFNP